jgi:hypothetical protein
VAGGGRSITVRGVMAFLVKDDMITVICLAACTPGEFSEVLRYYNKITAAEPRCVLVSMDIIYAIRKYVR